MIDIVLYVGRLLLIALLYLFLFAVMKTGIGIVKGQRKKSGVWTIAVVKGPKELRGVKINVTGPVVIGRSPGADIVIPASYVSGRHARVYPLGKDLLVEEMGRRGYKVARRTIAKYRGQLGIPLARWRKEL